MNWSHALLRRFHSSGVATLVPTPHMGEELRRHGYRHPVHWSRGVNLEMFSPHGPVLARPAGHGPVFLYVGRLAVEKNIDAFLRLALPGEKWVAGAGPEAARLRGCAAPTATGCAGSTCSPARTWRSSTAAPT